MLYLALKDDVLREMKTQISLHLADFLFLDVVLELNLTSSIPEKQ